MPSGTEPLRTRMAATSPIYSGWYAEIFSPRSRPVRRSISPSSRHVPNQEVNMAAARWRIVLMVLCFGWVIAPRFVLAAGGDSRMAPKKTATKNIPLINAGFEADDPYQGWSLNVYGAQPKITADTTIRHEGRRSLRISAGEPSDSALGQDVDLRPGQWYRLAGWVRTENLNPHGSPTCGTFQIQWPGGRGVVTTGKSHPGTNDWCQEVLYFTPPPGDGKTRIAVFFVGYGRGTGTAWFDDLTLEEVDAAVTTLTVTNEPICRGTISPFQYGQFIEYLCGLTPSMFAEQVFDGSFEGVPPYRVVFRKELDRLEKPWYPEGAVHRGDYA